MKQTAIDWLVDQVENFNCLKLGLIPSNIIEQAKQMEKHEIIQSHITGQSEWDYKPVEAINKKLAEQYYKETYEKDA